MPQTITRGYKAMVADAKKAIEEIEAQDAVKLAGSSAVVLVDLRDPKGH